jgi:hypothetical protein
MRPQSNPAIPHLHSQTHRLAHPSRRQQIRPVGWTNSQTACQWASRMLKA